LKIIVELRRQIKLKSLSVFCGLTQVEALGDRRLEDVAAEPLGDLILVTDVAAGGASP